MDAELFQHHPELRDGTYDVAYLGTGTVLLRPSRSARNVAVASDVDPVVAAYLTWTQQVMIAEPDRLRPMTPREFEVAEGLVAGTAVDPETDRLPDDFELP